MSNDWENSAGARLLVELRNVIDHRLNFFSPMDTIDLSLRITLAQSALPTVNLQLEFLNLVSAMLDKKMPAKSIIKGIDRIDFTQSPLKVQSPITFGDTVRIIILAFLFGAALLAIYQGWK